MSRVLMLLAPSKTMDFESALPYSVAVEQPLFLEQASLIAARVQRQSTKRLAQLMHISPTIAEAVSNMYAAWSPEQTGRPALWTYRGDVYKGMKAGHLPADSAAWAQDHLLILSGLYGLLRPNDGIQAYRLEMKAMLKLGRTSSVAAFWGKRLSGYIEDRGADWICNLSSDEYARPALKYLPATVTVVTPVFFDTKPNGTVGTVPIYSKMMRGVLCRWMIDCRVTAPEQLEAFTAHGYSYDTVRSKPGQPAFSRAVMRPLVF